MSKKDKDQMPEQQEAVEEVEETAEETAEETVEPEEVASPEETLQAALKEQEDKYLRLLAEYDNYRKRSQKEKENAWTNAKSDTAEKFLPVFDNLERALKQETADEAYAKGVEMIMTQFRTVLEKLGVEEIPAQGQTFDPNLHNAVMHIDSEDFGENTVAEVFQAGFKMGDKVIRHAMVKVAN